MDNRFGRRTRYVGFHDYSGRRLSNVINVIDGALPGIHPTHLGLARALQHFAGFDDTVELVTPVLGHRRGSVEGKCLVRSQALDRLGYC